MNATFADLVEEIRQRSVEEKGELLYLLQQDLIEARREEMAALSSEARREYGDGRLNFLSTVADLKRSLGKN